MYRPLFLLVVSSVAAVGGLIVASAMPTAAATSVRAETMALTQTGPCIVPTGSGSGTPCTPPATTPVTFTVTSTGVLAITAPDGTPTAVDLGTIVSGTAGTLGTAGNFGAITVTDNRALDPANWTATCSTTAFANTTTGLTADTLPATAATYIAGIIAADTASGLPLSTGITDDTGTGLPLTTSPQDIVTETGFDGDNAATWTPTIDITIPTNAVAGVYTGTVTHSVS